MKMINQINETYKVVWFLNNYCNFRCEYCLDQMGRDDKKFENNLIPDELIINACNNLLSLGHKNMKFTVFGGETTLYPDLPMFTDIIYQKMDSVLNDFMFTTNASRGIDYFKKFLKYDERFIIRVSIHMEYYTPKIFEIIKMLSKNHVRVFVEIMYNLKFKELVFECAKKIKKLKDKYPETLNGRIKPVFDGMPFSQEHYFYPYTKDDIKEFEEENKKFGRIQDKYKIDMKEPGKYCILGSNKIMIHPSGKLLYPCPMTHFSEKSIFFMSPQKFKQNLFKIVKCETPKMCLHAPKLKFNSKEEAKKIIEEIVK